MLCPPLYREETDIKIEFAESSLEACLEVRVMMTKGMIQMHKSKRWQKRLMDIYKFIDSMGNITLDQVLISSLHIECAVTRVLVLLFEAIGW